MLVKTFANERWHITDDRPAEPGNTVNALCGKAVEVVEATEGGVEFGTTCPNCKKKHVERKYRGGV